MNRPVFQCRDLSGTSPEAHLDTHLAERLSHWSGGIFPFGNMPKYGPNYKPDQEPGNGQANRTGNNNAAGLRAALSLWQLAMLADTVKRAQKDTLHYRALSDGAAPTLAAHAAELAATAVRSPDKTSPGELENTLTTLLHSLPFTQPEALGSAPERFLAVSHDDVAGIISLPTSGTTGQGKRVYCTPEDLANTIDFFRHGMRFMISPNGPALHTSGRIPTRRIPQNTGDRVALLMSGERPGSVGDLLQRAMHSLGVDCLVAGFPLNVEATLEALLRFRPTCLVGVPGHVLSLARHPAAQALRPTLHAVLLSGDSASPALRRAIGDSLACPVFVHYGLTEIGLGGAVSCPAQTLREHCACHMREADLLFETVDSTGRPLPPGAWGEVTVTTLTRRAMPLIRYRTGDTGRILPDNCACGSVFRLLDVRGRQNDGIPLPGGALLPCSALDQALYSLPFVRGYQAVVFEDSDQRADKRSVLVLSIAILEDQREINRTLQRVKSALTGLKDLEDLCPVRSSEECAAAHAAGRTPVLVRVAVPGQDSLTHAAPDAGAAHASPSPAAKQRVRQVRGSVPHYFFDQRFSD